MTTCYVVTFIPERHVHYVCQEGVFSNRENAIKHVVHLATDGCPEADIEDIESDIRMNYEQGITSCSDGFDHYVIDEVVIDQFA